MNEAASQAMASALVEFGHATPAQVAEWTAADAAAAQPQGMPGSALPAATAIQDRAAALVASGDMTPEQAAAAVAQYNTAPPPADGVEASVAKPAAQTVALAASNAADPFEGVVLPDGFGPPAKPTDYRLDALVAENLSLDQLRNVGETLHAAKLPTPIATQIVSEIASCHAQNLDEKGLKLMNARTTAQLRSVWGDQTEAKINVAAAFVRDLEKVRPGVLRLLEDSGAGSSPIVLRQLVEHAERLNAARGKK